jgi:hypothetical protein
MDDTGASADAETGSCEPGLASRPGPTGFDPARMLLDELNRGIVNLVAALDDTSTSDTFWYRYWAGYLHGYEKLRDRLRTAIAMEARQGGDGETRLHAEHDSAGLNEASPNPSRQDTSPSSKDET